MNLIVLSSDANEAEGLITALRNGGLPAHGTFTADTEDLDGVTGKQPCDILLCCVFDPAIDLDATLTQYKALARDIPLLLIAEAPISTELRTDALRAGVRDLIEHGDSVHLQLAVGREYKDLMQRRALAEVRTDLARCERRNRELVDGLADAAAVIQQGVHVSANPAYCALFGYAQAEDLDGYPMLDMVTSERQAEVKAFLRDVEVGKRSSPQTLLMGCLRQDGSEFEGELTAIRGENDGEPCVRLTVRVKEPPPAPVADAAPAEAPRAATDSGMPDRAALIEALEQRIGADSGEPLALIVVRVIGMNDFTRNEGLTATLDLATEVGEWLRPHVPEGGLVARVGDVTYAVVVQPATPPQARALAELLCRAGREPLVRHPSGGPFLTCIAGMATAGAQDTSATALLDRAFRSSEPEMTRSDAAGARPATPNAPAAAPAAHPSAPAASAAPAAPAPASAPPAFTPRPNTAKAPASKKKTGSQSDQATALAALVSEALSGIGRAELRLVYQPIVSLMGDSQEHYSVFLRLIDPDQQLHEAKEFIGAVAEAGLMSEVDRWVIQHAIPELASQRANGHKISFFINIAEDSLQDESLIDYVCDRLRESDARGNWVTFQFPEEEARRNLTALTRLVDGLSKVKCRVALSRCGQLDSPQMLMQSLHVDFLMFSHDFARGLAEDKVKQHQLATFAELAKEFNIKSIVTGVEDARALTVLWTAGIDYVQGNFLQRPSPTLEVRS